MPRQKRNSQIIEKAQRRLEALRSVDPFLNFGNNLSVSAYMEYIEQGQQAIAKYNTLLSMVDEAQQDVEEFEQQIADISTRLLQSVGARYGKQSVEYMKAGGRPRSAKRKPAIGGSTPLPTAPTTLPTSEANGVGQNGVTARA
ncbi:MAG: hypothetical protein HC781_21470 [Leptolyngbyaceae cyanobacterium CSU_1_4]|nr:hypothetical protein [Leptolyngbyaceae cyanobacterium CSU_1_4]